MSEVSEGKIAVKVYRLNSYGGISFDRKEDALKYYLRMKGININEIPEQEIIEIIGEKVIKSDRTE